LSQSDNTRFSRLVEIMAILRSENGCPWDREQSHSSLRQHLLEETYEVIETIDEGRLDELPGELGDLLLQIVFHAQMAAEEGRFTIDDVIRAINDKLIRRHPHVFGDAVVKTGGSSSIPAFTEMLGRLFGPERVVASNPFSSVTAGLSIRAYERSH